MKSPILGSSYVTRSPNAADSRMVNLYPEVVPDGGQEPAFLTRAPGMRYLCTIGTGPIRALWAHNSKGVFYAVSGQEVYRLSAVDAAPELIGTMTDTGGAPISVTDNGTQVFFSCNPKAYIWDAVAETFSEVSDTDFPGSGAVAFIDGYFLVNEPGTQKIYSSDIYDGTSWNALAFASAESSPDGVQTIMGMHRELWVFGAGSLEIWRNAATSPFPFAPIQGVAIEVGCSAPHSVVKLDNTIFWLGSNDRGRGVVYRADGYSPLRVSTHAVEWQIQQYADISDAVAYAYQQEGHAFYVLNFPSACTTWVYDVATGAWHERASFRDGLFKRHRSNSHCSFNGATVVGDYNNGNLYLMDVDLFADPIGTQKWLRSWRALPTGGNNLNRTTHHSLQLNCEAGTLPEGDGGATPKVRLRWSDDGGHTWSNHHCISTGGLGDYGHRVYWRRLGMTTKLRDRVYEVSGTDPVRITIMGAELIVTPTRA